MDWDAFLDQNGPVYDDLIREFYAGFSYDEEREGKNITFYVSSLCYKVTLSTFGLLLGIPSRGIRLYKAGHELTNLPPELEPEDVINCIMKIPNPSTSAILTTQLAYPHNKRYRIIDYNIMNRNGNHSQVPACVAALLFFLHHSTEVNLAYFVAKRMNGTRDNSNRSLPYGMLLNNLFHHTQAILTVPRNIVSQPLLEKPLPISRSRRGRRSTDHDEEDVIFVGEASGSGAQANEEDPFYSQSTDEKLGTIYRDLKAIKKEQSGTKKLLSSIMDFLKCNNTHND